MQPPGWTFTADALEQAATQKTCGIMINTPANPTGKVFTGEELKTIAAFAKKHDLFVFTDEIYEHFVYDGRQHVPPFSVPGIRERTITISGCSKVFSITGWRIGYIVCDAKWATTIGHFNDLYYVCTPAPLQLGAAAGLNDLPLQYYSDLCAEYRGKRDRMGAALTKAGLAPIPPQGSYYILADISSVPGKTSMDKALHFLDKTGVACVPGQAFYQTGGGENIARFCFARVDKVIDEACQRIEKYQA
jgi:aminotransferase